MTTSGFFGDAAHPVFGWWHPAAAPSELGVVLCPPIGQEMTNSWRTQQALADALAAQGMSCLRLDWAGSGNAADAPDDPERGAVPAWQASLDSAIDQLRACAGVSRVVVLAMRAGALVAGAIAARRSDVAGFVVLAPVVAGRMLLREWRAMSATAALREDHLDGTLEVGGIPYTARTLRALGELSLAELAWPVDKPVWIVDRDDLPTATRWTVQLREAGAPVTAHAAAGLADMLLEPHRQSVPQVVVADVVDWLRTWRDAAACERADPRPAGAAPAPAPGVAWREEAVVAPGVRERIWPVETEGTRLYGVLAEPVGVGRAGAVLLLPNTGSVHHVGNHRLYVQLARALAAEGHRVIRFDLSGLGESPPRAGEPADVVYGRRAIDDVAAVAAAARASWPQRDVALLGLCAGGYHALRTVVSHDRIAQAIVVNPLVYHWHQGMTLEAHAPLVQEAYYRAKWRNPQSWKRLLSGQSDLRQLVRVAAGRLARAGAELVGALRGGARTGVAADDLDRDLLTASDRGTRLHFVFADAEPGWPALQALGGRALARLQPTGQVRIHHIERADHTFTTASSRERFIALVRELLASAALPERPAPAASDAHAEPVARQRCTTAS